MKSSIRTWILWIVLFLMPVPTMAETKLSTIFQPEMLNVQINYLESVIGPAMHVFPANGTQIRDYRVEGCRVTAYTRGPDVIGYSLDLGPRCNMDIRRFLGPGYTMTSGLTLGRFASGPFGTNLSLYSYCIYLCGNAADPTIDFTFEGPHAVNYITVILTVVLAGSSSLDASQRLVAAMQTYDNEDYILKTRFNCDTKYSTQANRLFANVPVSRITVGYNLDALLHNRKCN